MSAPDGIITTVAGDGQRRLWGDGGPATLASFSSPSAAAVDEDGNVYVADTGNARIRKIDVKTGIVSTFAGGGNSSGDGGPATAAALGSPASVSVGQDGTVLITDSFANLIRAVPLCRPSLGAFDSSYPGDGSLVSAGALAVNWAKSDAAFRYDVVLDTEFPPKRVVQGDVTGQGFQLSGLEPGKTYYWQVRAKGDPYCPAVERTSGVRRFTVPMPCLSPAAPVLASPQNPGTNTTLTFIGVPGASSYDVYLGTGATLPVVASGLTGSSYAASGLQPGTTYRWRVAAHASCNTELTTSSLEATFTVSGGCGAPQSAVPSSPAGGTTGLGQETTLLWQPVTGAGSYDVYLGTGSEPSLLANEVTGTSLEVSLQ
ncbi:MAG: hypothetical protein L6R30_16525, partial [Thermoanaerobaculia bacterium]|nr:hypothetical protein [Thermoanaerobaculia bacterium]